eukprot:gene29832-36950_t
MKIYDFNLHERPYQLIPYSISAHENFTLRFRDFEKSASISSTTTSKSTKSVSFKHPIASWSVDEECKPFSGSDTASNSSCSSASSDDGSVLLLSSSSSSDSSEEDQQQESSQTAVLICGLKQQQETLVTQKVVCILKVQPQEQHTVLKETLSVAPPTITPTPTRHSWSSRLRSMVTSSITRREVAPPPQ